MEDFACIQVCEFNSKRVITLAQYIEKNFSQGNHLNPSRCINIQRKVFVTHIFEANVKERSLPSEAVLWNDSNASINKRCIELFEALYTRYILFIWVYYIFKLDSYSAYNKMPE